MKILQIIERVLSCDWFDKIMEMKIVCYLPFSDDARKILKPAPCGFFGSVFHQIYEISQ